MKKKRRKKVAITGVNTQIFKQANPEYENKNKQRSEHIETPKAEFEKNYRVNLAICLNENPLTKKYQRERKYLIYVPNLSYILDYVYCSRTNS